MKKLFGLLLLIYASGLYSGSEKKKESVPTTKIIKTPQHTPSTGVTVHKRSINFIDIEAPADQVWIGCSNENPESSNAFLSVYIADSDILYHFFYRRPLERKKLCPEEREEYLEFLKGAKKIRVVGSFGFIEDEINPQPSKDTGAPRHFTNKPTIVAAYFIRIQTEDKCKAYFSNHCDLPQNYWAGTLPLE